jgi:hypothetical protein
MKMPAQGGGVSKVVSVEFDDFELLPGASIERFDAEATWNVIGTVDHWGHAQYRAYFTVRLTKGQYKVASMKVKTHEPMNNRVSLRCLSDQPMPEISLNHPDATSVTFFQYPILQAKIPSYLGEK